MKRRIAVRRQNMADSLLGLGRRRAGLVGIAADQADNEHDGGKDEHADGHIAKDLEKAPADLAFIFAVLGAYFPAQLAALAELLAEESEEGIGSALHVDFDRVRMLNPGILDIVVLNRLVNNIGRIAVGTDRGILRGIDLKLCAALGADGRYQPGFQIVFFAHSHVPP